MASRRPRTSRHHSARGFTLIELVMVMVLVGILAVFILPNLQATRGFDAVGYRDALRATLEYARKSAVAQRRNVQVVLTGNTLVLTIDNVGPESAGAGTYPRALALPVPGRYCGAGVTNQLCAPGNASFTVTGTPTTLTFDPLGRPSAAASYTVTGLNAVTVAAESGYVQ